MYSIEKGVSIIVPTHGRVSLLEQLLRSLKEARTVFPFDTEILLLDSSSLDDRVKIQSLCNTWDAELHIAPNHVCLKRNIGIEKSQFDTIFFIDSDCEADKEVLVKHFEFQKQLSVPSAILGFTDWVGPRTRMWKVLDLVTGFGSAFNFAKWFDAVPWGACTNLMVEKSWLLEIGGFDESFPMRVFGDDVDLGIRLNKAGYKIVCNPDAIVRHNRLPYRKFTKLIHKYWLSGRADFHLGRKHPERMVRDVPGPVTIILLLLLLSAGKTILGHNPGLLLIPIIWGLVFLLFSSLFMIITKKRRFSSFFFQILALIPMLSFEAGKIYESLINLKPMATGLKFVYINEQIAAEHGLRMIKLFLIILTLPVALIIIFLL